jgi:uncharacterized cysteine cluster protein YcgN (CxxCxxCC family)
MISSFIETSLSKQNRFTEKTFNRISKRELNEKSFMTKLYDDRRKHKLDVIATFKNAIKLYWLPNFF